MSRPRPLKNLASAINCSDDNASLTPRTPHSQTARLESGFARLQVSEATDFEDSLFVSQQQSAPLLASSTSGRFTAAPRSSKRGNTTPRPSSREPLSPFSRVLLVCGVGVAGILLLLITISLTRPEALYHYLGLDHLTSKIHENGHPTKPHQAGHPVISYENYTTFPLSSVDYFLECQKQMPGYMSHGDYWDHPHGSHPVDVEHFDKASDNICNSTITYMLDGRVGLAADLALMAQAAALARERNRTFFVDDTQWTRGKWLDYFESPLHLQPGREPGCLPPPPQELVACPRIARHWVVSSLTAKYHFGHEYENYYENPYGHQLNRAKPIFQFAEESLASTIRPNDEMTSLINTAKQELVRSIPKDDTPIIDEHSSESTYISVHIRRGDRYPHGWEYHRKPIPVKEYVDAVVNRTGETQEGATPNPAVVYVASDSPAQIQEFNKAYIGPTFSLATSTRPELKSIASPGEYFQVKFNALPLEQRRLATKGALVDLALVTGLWDPGRDPQLHTAVCSASSNFGRLAAIGLGWEKAFGGVNHMGEMNDETKRWVDVDLKGHELPVWQAFELF